MTTITETPRPGLAPRGRGEEHPAVASTPRDVAAGSLDIPRVVGVDLSLTSTGLACLSGCDTITTTGTAKDPVMVRAQRIRAIRDQVIDWCRHAHLVVIEAPSFGSRGAFTADRDGLWWLVVDGLIRLGVPFAPVAPKSRAKYITGNGNAKKPEVVEAAKVAFRSFAICGDDEADAVGLLAMGLDRLGFPLCVMPAAQRETLTKVHWPELVAHP